MQLKIQNGVVELSGEPILKAVNIEINDQSKIAVVGRNGCGKTTLLRLILGLEKAQKGEIIKKEKRTVLSVLEASFLISVLQRKNDQTTPRKL